MFYLWQGCNLLLKNGGGTGMEQIRPLCAQLNVATGLDPFYFL